MEDRINRDNERIISAPVQPHERIQVIDIIRGFALLGILIINMNFFSNPIIYLNIMGENISHNIWDKIIIGVEKLLVEGKFYSMFSFLFGLGFMIFVERASKRVRRPTLLFYRRVLILLVIGLIHAFLIWSGDILVSYALLAFLLPIFHKRKPNTILIWALILLLLAVMIVGFSVYLVNVAGAENYKAYMTDFMKQIELQVNNSLYAYGQGTYADIINQRIYDTLFMYENILFTFFLIFPMFLLGVWAGKKQIFYNLEDNIIFIKKLWFGSLIIGISMSLLKYFSELMIDPYLASKWDVISMVGRIFGDPGLCIFYMSSIILLCRNQTWLKRLSPLAKAGRMALSNYLFQSIVATLIFYSFGLGLYGKIGPAVGLIITIVIFSTQLVLSKIWFNKFRYGPMEWLWRTLTYGRI
jgi:uncharacterized protein